MLFTTSTFLIFLIVTLAVYYLPLMRRYQVSFLILASLFFYAWEIPYYIGLIVVSILINGLVSYCIAHSSGSSRRRWLLVGIIANLGLLAFFKYGRLFASSWTALTGQTELEALQQLPLPLGISFYTFQGISLIVDTYRQDNVDLDPSLGRHLLKTALFISIFPHQIAGPIVRASLLYGQVGEKSWRDSDFAGAARALVLGYFLKMVIADNLKDYTFWIDHPYFVHFSRPVVWSMLFGYSFQIFADFAGYSLIAIGLARLFGYELCINFNYPYIASSFREFWTRWHISLSGWLRDYLYIPLGGNRVGAIRTGINLLIVMGLGGLWHGAAWGFALWGLFHGIALVLERIFGSFLRLPDIWPVRFIRILFVFVFVSFAWSLFRITEWPHLMLFVKHMFTASGIKTDFAIVSGNILYSIPIVVYHILYLSRETRFGQWVRRREAYLYGICLFLLITNSGMTDRFIYFQF